MLPCNDKESYHGQNPNSCDVCGNEYFGNHCPKCVIKCPFCNEILCEEVIDAYYVGNCPHLICLYNPHTDYIIWKNKDYEQRFDQFCEDLKTRSIDQVVNGESLMPYDTEKAKLDFFTITNEMLSIEHNIYNDPLHNGSQLLYVKTEHPP